MALENKSMRLIRIVVSTFHFQVMNKAINSKKLKRGSIGNHIYFVHNIPITIIQQRHDSNVNFNRSFKKSVVQVLKKYVFGFVRNTDFMNC